MDKPAPYFITYEDSQRYAAELARRGDPELVDPEDVYVQEDAASRLAAQNMARRASRHNATTVFIYKRLNIEDDTPADFPIRGYSWKWDEELVTDVTA